MMNGSDWDTFYRSGKVEDYLTFCRKRDDTIRELTEKEAEKKHAELYGGFRTGAESGTHRGI